MTHVHELLSLAAGIARVRIRSGVATNWEPNVSAFLVLLGDHRGEDRGVNLAAARAREVSGRAHSRVRDVGARPG